MKMRRLPRSRLDESDFGPIQRQSGRSRHRTPDSVDVIRPEYGCRHSRIRTAGRPVANPIASRRPTVKIVEGNEVRLRCAAVSRYGEHDVIIRAARRRVYVKTKLGG